MLKGILKGGECNSSDELEEVFTKVWDEVTVGEVQSIFHNQVSRLAWVIEKRGEYIIE
jgi:hypothetical protein